MSSATLDNTEISQLEETDFRDLLGSHGIKTAAKLKIGTTMRRVYSAGHLQNVGGD